MRKAFAFTKRALVGQSPETVNLVLLSMPAGVNDAHEVVFQHMTRRPNGNEVEELMRSHDQDGMLLRIEHKAPARWAGHYLRNLAGC